MLIMNKMKGNRIKKKKVIICPFFQKINSNNIQIKNTKTTLNPSQATIHIDTLYCSISYFFNKTNFIILLDLNIYLASLHHSSFFLDWSTPFLHTAYNLGFTNISLLAKFNWMIKGGVFLWTLYITCKIL